MTSPLERIARVLYEQSVDGRFKMIPADQAPFDWDDLIPDSKAPFLKDARAVLTAIREPFQSFDDPVAVAGAEVLGVGKDRPLHWSNHDEAKRVWQAMIDAALTEKPE